ncbi:MAG: DUF4126 family protein [Sandaracinus sp.]|nr:DUF4126 family protein [Sandaracinus sp.]MCB9612280.1 DUF4126 family protein [Sandaracinus sp.]MCB9621034.1 DUF4126 family protein [Sandaracinus sp.]
MGDELRIAELSMAVGIRPTVGLALTSGGICLGFLQVSGPLEVLGHPVGFALAATLAVFEMSAERDEDADFDLDEAMGIVRGIAAIIAVWATSSALSSTMNHDLSAGSTFLHSTIAGGTAVVRAEIRRRVSDYLSSAGAGLMARIEEGGLVAILVGVFFFPLVVVVMLFLLSLAALLTFVGTWVVDKRRRRPCVHCGHAARNEAMRCPVCQGALEPAAYLSPPSRLSAWVGEQRGRIEQAVGQTRGTR